MKVRYFDAFGMQRDVNPQKRTLDGRPIVELSEYDFYKAIGLWREHPIFPNAARIDWMNRTLSQALGRDIKITHYDLTSEINYGGSRLKLETPEAVYMPPTATRMATTFQKIGGLNRPSTLQDLTVDVKGVVDCGRVIFPFAKYRRQSHG